MDTQTEHAITRDLLDPSRRREAFSRLVKELSKPLYWQIRRLVVAHDAADDVLQNTFLKAWQNIDSFRGDSRLSTWMYRIAINESYSYLNRERLQSVVDFKDLEDTLADSLYSDPWFSGDDAARKLQEAILQLPDKQRLVFNMRYYDEMKYEDMSQLLGTSVGALKASYHLAVKKVQAFITADLYE